MDQRVIQLLIDSFGQILLPGLTMTIPLTVISFSLATADNTVPTRPVMPNNPRNSDPSDTMKPAIHRPLV